MTNRNKKIYWVLTILMFVPAGVGGAVELFTNGPASIVQIMLALGYPLYLMKILGFAKILGSIAILYERFPRLKDWAYAGFAFDYLGATASHILSGDSAHAVYPCLFFIVMMASYYLWQRISSPFRSRSNVSYGPITKSILKRSKICRYYLL